MNGNIVSVRSKSKTTSYVYDSANQLIRENNEALGKTWAWIYDAAGNILSKSEYDYTTADTLGTATDTVSYVYDTGAWGDLLKTFDGQAITYDGIGNPTKIGSRTFTWQHGRELATLTEGGVTWSNTYNADGLRIKRTNGTLTYQYYYAGGQLVRIAIGSKYIDFSYDASGMPMSLYYSGYGVTAANYYYVTNIQGDVIAILDDSGTAVVTYTYDAWGNILTVGGSMADTLGVYNPLRYRGYVYDVETSLYYLQSRYYDPNMGRFLNADALTSTGQGLLGNNMYVYCGNNPVNRYDDGGMLWRSIWNRVKKAVNTVLHAGNTFAMEMGIDTASLGAYFLNMKKDKNGIYHATFDCWQQYFGYNDLYDIAFDIGTSMMSCKFSFKSGGKSYMLWGWKGDYINLGAGAELGIYYGGGPHWYVDKSLAMTMYMTLSYNGSIIISYSSKTWWITGFNPRYQNVYAGNLRVTFTIVFNSYTMFNDFRRSNPKGWTFSMYNCSATYTF